MHCNRILGVLNELADTLELNASELSITYQMNQLFFHVQEATVHQYSGVVFSVSSLQNESDLTNATFLASSGDGSKFNILEISIGCSCIHNYNTTTVKKIFGYCECLGLAKELLYRKSGNFRVSCDNFCVKIFSYASRPLRKYINNEIFSTTRI